MCHDPIARLFQASLNSSSKRTVVIDEVYGGANQILNPQAPVSRIRSSYHRAADSSANFGFERTLETSNVDRLSAARRERSQKSKQTATRKLAVKFISTQE